MKALRDVAAGLREAERRGCGDGMRLLLLGAAVGECRAAAKALPIWGLTRSQQLWILELGLAT